MASCIVLLPVSLFKYKDFHNSAINDKIRKWVWLCERDRMGVIKFWESHDVCKKIFFKKVSQ